MSRYDGLIIPRSYSEYINKTDAATLQQALQLSGVLSGTVAAGDNKAVKSDAVKSALAGYAPVTTTGQLPINSHDFNFDASSYPAMCLIFLNMVCDSGDEVVVLYKGSRNNYAVASLGSSDGIICENVNRQTIKIAHKVTNYKIYNAAIYLITL